MDFVNYHPKVKEYSKFLVKFSAKASEVIGIKLGFQIVRKNKWEDYVNDDNDEETWKNLPEKLKEKGLSADNDGIALAVLKK